MRTRFSLALGFLLAAGGDLRPQQVTLPDSTTGAPVNAGDSANKAVRINCITGCGGAASFNDNSAFTAGTTGVTNIGGVFNDSITALTSGNAGAPRLTSKRAIHFNLRDNSGNEVPFPAALDADLGFKVHVQNTLTADVNDRAARLLGVVYGSQGQQLKQTATNFNLQMELAAGGTLYDARLIRALTSTDVVTCAQTTAANLLGTMKLLDTAGTNLASILANDATAIGNGLEVQPSVARASPTAITAGRSEKLQQSTTNGGVFANLVGGAGTTVADVFGNDATAAGNGVQVQDAIAKAGPAATTAGRSELQQLDTVSGGVYNTPSPTSNNVGLSSATFTANTALNIKASAGNIYGWSAINAAATVCWLQFYNTAGAPTCGTSVIWSVPLPVTPGVSNVIADIPFRNHATGIAICVSTTATGATTCGSVASGTIFFK